MANGSVSKHVSQRRDHRGRPITTYRWRADLPVGPDGIRRQKKLSGYTTRRAAETALRAFLVDVEQGEYVAVSDLTVDEAITEWLATRRNVEPTTIYGYTAALRYVGNAIGHRPIQSITRHDLDHIVTHMHTLGRSRATTAGGSRPLAWCNSSRVALRTLLTMP
jgi:hypothetical protein